MTDTSTSTAVPAPGTRDRLIAAMLGALQRRGLHGVGLNELLATAQAPKGVLYHHFPGGKAELAVAAVKSAVAHMNGSLERLLQRSAHPVDALAAWMASAQKFLSASGFEQGCPLATIALESTPEDEAIRAALARGFAGIRERVAQALAAAGLPDAQARNLAALIVSAYEGALLQARVAGRVDAMRETCDALLELVRLQIATNTQQAPT
jgi:TetR/AcrR family transcriptional regulator, lmrAB and yxaGH operons repressor